MISDDLKRDIVFEELGQVVLSRVHQVVRTHELHQVGVEAVEEKPVSLPPRKF